MPLLQVTTALHYWPNAIHGKQPLAAIVNSVRRDKVVDVTVFTANGDTMAAYDVPLIEDEDTATGPHCTWPAQSQDPPVANAAGQGFSDRGEP